MQQQWKHTIKKVGWAMLGITGIAMLVAAVNSKNNKVCKDINIEITGAGNNFFVDKKEVKRLLDDAGVQGKSLEAINLQQIERSIEKDKWIANAELFFDNKNVLQVMVEENEPVARIFTAMGTSFYIDSACKPLPLSDKLSARVPMFTSFPSERRVWKGADSQLMASIKDMATFIQQDDFWKAQVAQIDITPAGFDMVPTMGNHIVAFGKPENIEAKFDRLFSFYKQVWTKVGLEKYAKIDVQFDGQVVATKRGDVVNSIDSSQARLALQTLLTTMQKNNVETMERALPNAGKAAAKYVNDPAGNEKGRPAKQTQTIQQPPDKPVDTKINNTKPVPKAIMQKPVKDE